MLSLADPEYFGAALRAHTLSGRFFVLHSDFLRVLDLYFLPALHAICGHSCTSFATKHNTFGIVLSIPFDKFVLNSMPQSAGFGVLGYG